MQQVSKVYRVIVIAECPMHGHHSLYGQGRNKREAEEVLQLIAKEIYFYYDECELVNIERKHLPQPSANIPNPYEDNHNFIASPALTWRDIDGKPYIHINYRCECGEGKYERFEARYIEDDGQSHNIKPDIARINDA